MISYVKGILAEKAKDRIVVESGMMGIGIFVPMSVLRFAQYPFLASAARERGEALHPPAGAGG